MLNLLTVALLITVVIWMLITTVLYAELQKQVMALKDLEKSVVEAQKGDIREALKHMGVLAQILEYICEDAQDSYETVKQVVAESEDNKKFAIKTVLRAQEVLKKCNAIRDEVQALHSAAGGAEDD